MVQPSVGKQNEYIGRKACAKRKESRHAMGLLAASSRLEGVSRRGLSVKRDGTRRLERREENTSRERRARSGKNNHHASEESVMLGGAGISWRDPWLRVGSRASLLENKRPTLSKRAWGTRKGESSRARERRELCATETAAGRIDHSYLRAMMGSTRMARRAGR